MCVSNRIEQFSASYFLAGLSPPVPLVILLAQVAHEQDEDDDGPGTEIAAPAMVHATSDMPPMWRRTPMTMPTTIGIAVNPPIA